MAIELPNPPFRVGYSQDGNSWREQGALEDEWRYQLVEYLRYKLSPPEVLIYKTADQTFATGVSAETFDTNYTVVTNDEVAWDTTNHKFVAPFDCRLYVYEFANTDYSAFETYFELDGTGQGSTVHTFNGRPVHVFDLSSGEALEHFGVHYAGSNKTFKGDSNQRESSLRFVFTPN